MEKVNYGKPSTGGAIKVGPITATLPTSASATVTGFKSLGSISEDGLVNSNSPTVENKKAWGGDVVMTMQTERPDTFTYTLLESTNVEVLKEVFGDDNVDVNDSTGEITIKANDKELDEHAYVVDMILKGGTLKRIVIPKGRVTAVGDVTYKDNDAICYNVTLSCAKDATGNTHYEYIV